MLINSVKDSENNRRGRNVKKTKRKKNMGTEAIAKGWERNDFVEPLS